MTAFIANTNLLELTGLKSAVEGVYINDALITVTVKDKKGQDVPGVSWPVSMVYVNGSEGDYRATLVHTIEFVPKREYRAFIEVDAGADRIGHWEFPFTPLVRTGVPIPEEV